MAFLIFPTLIYGEHLNCLCKCWWPALLLPFHQRQGSGKRVTERASKRSKAASSGPQAWAGSPAPRGSCTTLTGCLAIVERWGKVTEPTPEAAEMEMQRMLFPWKLPCWVLGYSRLLLGMAPVLCGEGVGSFLGLSPAGSRGWWEGRSGESLARGLRVRCVLPVTSLDIHGSLVRLWDAHTAGETLAWEPELLLAAHKEGLTPLTPEGGCSTWFKALSGAGPGDMTVSTGCCLGREN